MLDATPRTPHEPPNASRLGQVPTCTQGFAPAVCHESCEPHVASKLLMSQGVTITAIKVTSGLHLQLTVSQRGLTPPHTHLLPATHTPGVFPGTRCQRLAQAQGRSPECKQPHLGGCRDQEDPLVQLLGTHEGSVGWPKPETSGPWRAGRRGSLSYNPRHSPVQISMAPQRLSSFLIPCPGFTFSFWPTHPKKLRQREIK